MLSLLRTYSVKLAAPATRKHALHRAGRLVMSAAQEHCVVLYHRQQPTTSAGSLLQQHVSCQSCSHKRIDILQLEAYASHMCRHTWLCKGMPALCAWPTRRLPLLTRAAYSLITTSFIATCSSKQSLAAPCWQQASCSPRRRCCRKTLMSFRTTLSA